MRSNLYEPCSANVSKVLFNKFSSYIFIVLDYFVLENFKSILVLNPCFGVSLKIAIGCKTCVSLKQNLLSIVEETD